MIDKKAPVIAPKKYKCRENVSKDRISIVRIVFRLFDINPVIVNARLINPIACINIEFIIL